MKFADTVIPRAFLISIDPVVDERGFFARTFCREEFARQGLETCFSQISVSHNTLRGTLRGLHYQAEPHGEVKLVRCIRGAVFDVMVDLRSDSPAYRRWVGYELSENNRNALYIPNSVAHGFLTLSDSSELEYLISTPYVPESSRGVRWNDPAFGILWPGHPRVISARDKSFEDFVG
jgi:dTDP-4-dehydrorhamnose 3,5-epimerase